MRLTAITLILAPGTIKDAIANVFFTHALVVAAVNRIWATGSTLSLIRLIQAINVAITDPIIWQATLLIALEPRANRILCPKSSLTHLLIAHTLISVGGLNE